MKRWQKWFSSTLLLTTLLTPLLLLTPKAQACECVNTYHDDDDVAGYAQYAVIAAKYQYGFMDGDENGYFHPTAHITREELAVVLAKALNLELPATRGETSQFTDVQPGSWSSAYLEAVAQAGLMSGEENGQFHPHNPITREQLAATLVRALHVDVTGQGKNLVVADRDQVSPWARDAVQVARAVGLMHGDTLETFNPQAPAERQQVAVVMVNYLIRQSVQAQIDQKLQAIQEKNVTKFLATIDPEKAAYKREQQHWFEDVVASPVTDYKLEIRDLVVTPPMAVAVSLVQTYTLHGERYELPFQERYTMTEQGWLDSDLLFEKLIAQHFLIYYRDGDQATAEKVQADAEAAYTELQKRYPHEKPAGQLLEIKLYNDPELLRQSVKLSFAWQFAGWYEYGEAIKLSAKPGAQGFYQAKIQHEMVHELTIAQSNNNLPYWLAEGLAVYYSADEQFGVPVLPDTYTSIADLETLNLEALTDSQEISQYYNQAGNIITFLADTYGEGVVRKLVQELGTYPYQDGTTSHHDDLNRQHLRAIIPNVLNGKTLDQLDTEWQNWIKEKTLS
ncbi:S-layer homology domain-containing protein [Tumebacillus permanentifrigoris]|uniref:S-layer family protein n=1 Tax=Tumebacillus permanentifrigoris TaxID=378543 RepID=A0A316DCA2_9BACL|nr:S-layer homology domain-containing protein [Tumebacillus permanentifrigoris]PWK15585.1 S-layer family protein [Tumebacillus permanentifrigoris]